MQKTQESAHSVYTTAQRDNRAGLIQWMAAAVRAGDDALVARLAARWATEVVTRAACAPWHLGCIS